MSRARRFAHSLFSGYVLLGVNSVYTLASVPLALHYLSKEEFGLWALTTQIAGYVALVDFGLSASASRILIDYKDRRTEGEYGSVVQTGALVGLSQGCLVFLVGMVVAFMIGPLLHIPQALEKKFFWLVVTQCALTAAGFSTRILTHMLTAHQRFDASNYAAVSSFVVMYGVMWWGFARGLGVYSLPWSQAFGNLSLVGVSAYGCYKLGLFPRRHEWGRPAWTKFRELFAFGRDYFLFAVGSQFVNSSQTLLLTRLLGLDAAAVWSVCTRAYLVLAQVIYRIFDYSASAMAEMMVRGERDLLLRRFRQVAVFSVNLSVAAAAMFAICNGPFITIWTGGKIEWSPWNDVILGVWLVIGVGVRTHAGLVGQTKAFGFLRYIYFFEGFTFIVLTILLHRLGGITLMLCISVACSLCFSFPYGLERTRKYFGLRWVDLARWHRDTLVLAVTIVPIGFLTWWSTRSLSVGPRLAVNFLALGIWSTCMFLRFGLGDSLRAEASRRAPAWVRPILIWTGVSGSKN